MKSSEFKKMIKDAVKEAFQEELKEILMEAVRSPKGVINESYAQPKISNPKQLTPSERQSMFGGIMNEMQNGVTANSNSIPFRSTGPVDPVNGSLPEGEVGLDLIMGLMSGNK